jgi:hypothetical protein
MLPFMDVPICAKLFLNAEAVRTIYSRQQRYPGLFGVANNLIATQYDENYLFSSVGIPVVAYSKAARHDAVAPHSAFPLFLSANSGAFGVAWLATMLNSTKSQTSLGAIDAVSIYGWLDRLSFRHKTMI